jgi:broad specificity phosphatase PhoE
MPEQLQTIVFLVRHGETDHEYSQLAGQDATRQLTDLGKHQSQVVGQYLDQFQPAAIYSSPLDRCRDTAVAIQKEIGLNDEIIFANQLVEIYSNEPRAEAGERGESIFATILHDHAGDQVVAVTHQYIIGYIVADFMGVSFRDVPCDFADIYRLVFAGFKLVEATRLQPVKNAV